MCRTSFLALVVASLTLLSVCPAYGAFDPARDPALVGWWSFDEGEGTVAADGSPNGNHGTVNGGATWVPGVYGGALQFNGTNAYVGTGKSLLSGLAGFTLAGWISAGSTGVYSSVFGQNDLVELGFTTESNGQFGTWMLGNNWAFIGANWGFAYPSWHHVALTGNADRIALYIDGKELARDENGMVSGTSTFLFSIAGNVFNASGDWFRGEIDDVWLFRRALTAAEIGALMKGPGGPGRATAPIPVDEAIDVPRDVTLGWKPGEFAAAHDVYFGTSSDDVNDAGRTAPLGVLAGEGQTAAAYDPADLLDFARTYFWRVDEVNAAPDNTIYKGKVWSFTTEPYGYPVAPVAAKASSFQFGAGPQNTINGSGLSAADAHSTDLTHMWMTNGPQPHWIQYEFDKVYKLHELWVWNSNQPIESIVGFGARNVKIECSADGVAWTAVEGVPEFAQGTGLSSYTANTVVNLGGATAKFVKLTVTKAWGSLTPQTGLSEIRFFYVPVQAREPQPADAATNVDVGASLNWRPGREATSHEVYFGADENALPLAGTAAEHRYTPASMNFGTTYFWKVNELGGSGPYEGGVWSFTTQEYAVIDDMESYNDDDQRIYDSWIDGLTTKASNSQVGYDVSPFAETTTVHGGKQSMPLKYDNAASPFFSEAERTFDPARNWTANGADTLSLYFHGATPAFVETAGGRVLMNAIGADIWDASDQFRLAYKILTGNGTMIARVESIANSNAWAKGGVMIRQSAEPGSTHAFMAITPGGSSAGNGASFQHRLVAAGASTNSDSTTVVAPPYWVKVERSGNSFTGSLSPDGKTWTQLGTAQTITMTGPVLIGLALCSHSATVATGAEFSNVSFAGNVTGTWQVAEIGVAQPAGNSMESLYLTVKDTSGKSKTVVNPNAAATAKAGWNPWKIPLSEFTSAGVKMNAVKSMVLGVGSKTSPATGGAGTLFIDDISYGRPLP
jgi:hypothetical protein